MMTRVAKILSLAIVILGLAIGAAWALDLKAAKAQGLVGERPDGFLGAVKPGDSAVAALIKDINAQRLDHYKAIAVKRGTSVIAVEQYVGQKLISRAQPGEYVMTPGGQWVRK